MNTNTLSMRRYDIDWLRIVATYLLFVFHVAMVFNPAPFYHIRNSEVSFTMLVIAGFISLWHMPLFFLLAGWSAFSSLQARGTGGFLKERVLRLWIPLVMGCVILMPPIKYVELQSGLDLNHTGLYVASHLQDGFRLVIPSGLPVAAPFDESFAEFLPTFFTRPTRFTWAHLWFVAYLLTFTLLYLPFFVWLRDKAGDVSRPGVGLVYAPILALAVVQLTLRERWPGLQNLYDDWANFAFYSTYVMVGFLLARYPALEHAVRREWKRALTIGLVTAVGLLLGVLGVIRSSVFLLVGSAVAGWCFVVALLGIARTFLAFTNSAQRYLAESAFPVYLLHQSGIVLLGYFLIQLPLGVAAKYALLLLASVSATVAVYHFGVRRFAMARFLCGMKGAHHRTTPTLAPRYSAAVLTLVVWVTLGGEPAVAATPLGVWYAEGGAARVEITTCGEELCGRVVWLRSPFDENGCVLRDRSNPDASLRRQPLLGLEILRGLRRSGDDANLWSGGTVYDPATGNEYRAKLMLEDANRLRLRGYLGIPLIGRTTTWIRVGTEHLHCEGDS